MINSLRWLNSLNVQVQVYFIFILFQDYLQQPYISEKKYFYKSHQWIKTITAILNCLS